jgi:hypothetical protein
VIVGPDELAKSRATAAALDAGCTTLEAKIVGHVASWGGACWQTDGTLQEVLRRPDGRPYHRESIARCRRWLRDRGFLTSQRLYMGAKIEHARARFPVGAGTTFKTVIWKRLDLRNPMTRAERRRRRVEQAQAEREKQREKQRQELREQVQLTSGVRTAFDTTTKKLSLDAELAAQVKRAEAAISKQWAAAENTGPVPVRSAAAVRGPPE